MFCKLVFFDAVQNKRVLRNLTILDSVLQSWFSSSTETFQNWGLYGISGFLVVAGQRNNKNNQK